MKPHVSRVGAQFSRESGTRLLMDDLGAVARAPGDYVNLGGGNPARVPAVHHWLSDKFAELAQAREFDPLFAAYEDPLGPAVFRTAVADYLRDRLGWPVTREHVMCTAGSQASFFILFNVLAGPDEEGRSRRILFPQSPEYIGYSELCLAEGGLTAVPSLPVFTDEHRFRYHIDFDALRIDPTIAALCISRPTNPTGNVCTDEELARLQDIAHAHSIPLILDCAYGEPFPGISFVPGRMSWTDNLVACFSLSKLGMPGMRAGIVVADPELIGILSNMNAAMVLSANPIGARVALDLFASGQLGDIVDREVRPFYLAQSQRAVALCDRLFAGLDYFLHEPGGAIFLWVWFRGLPISSAALYSRLKARGVLVIPGHLFTPGIPDAPRQVGECIRISYAQPPEVLARGMEIIAEEVRRAFAGR